MTRSISLVDISYRYRQDIINYAVVFKHGRLTEAVKMANHAKAASKKLAKKFAEINGEGKWTHCFVEKLFMVALRLPFFLSPG